jgi:transcriptional regulator with XRE-family HTH domain
LLAGMALYTGGTGHAYARSHMPQAARGQGPWGEAVTYWLNYHGWSQADLARATGLEAKTVSTIVRGFHTQTRQLEKIAAAFKVPFDQVLLSPLRRLKDEERAKLAQDIAVRVMRELDNPPPPLHPPSSLPSDEDIGRAIVDDEKTKTSIARVAPPKRKAHKRK